MWTYNNLGSATVSIGKNKIFLKADSDSERTMWGRIEQGRRELAVALRRDISVEKLAELIELSAPSLYQWRSERSKPTEGSLEKLARLFQSAGLARYSIRYLRYGEDDPPSKAPAVRLR
jgi:transcriptional regulator with XRE-family HTH domain